MDQRSQPLAQLERDAAIARISRTRRWLIGAAAGLTAGIVALISAVAPGRSFAAHSTAAASGSPRPVSSTASARASTKLPPLEGAQALGLGGPAQAPQASAAAGSGSTDQAQVSPDQTQAPSSAQSGPPVVSGGS
jgi:hypothetical protein